MKNVLSQSFNIKNGTSIPAIGLGTWQIPEGEVCYNAVRAALDAGYTHIDTAFAYGNEKSVGKAVRDSGIDRKKIYVTSKVPAEIKTADGAREHIMRSVDNLGLGYVDLMLIHAPKPWREMNDKFPYRYEKENAAVFNELLSAVSSGAVVTAGVSNFIESDIDNLVSSCNALPLVNQIRACVGDFKKNLIDYCIKKEIVVEGYSPLATGSLIGSDLLKPLCEKYKRSFSQICLRYLLAHSLLPLPKSTHAEFIKENTDLDFELEDKDVACLDSLTK